MADLKTTLSHVDDMYGNWFLDYASYVILERAVPHIYDGLKPVQRRILHVLKTMDDGRLHKVANVAGRTTAFHPHGNVAIDICDFVQTAIIHGLQPARPERSAH